MSHSLLSGQCHYDLSDRLDTSRRIETQQCPASGDALVDLLQEPWVAHLILHQPVGVLFGVGALDARLL